MLHWFMIGARLVLFENNYVRNYEHIAQSTSVVLRKIEGGSHQFWGVSIRSAVTGITILKLS